MKLSTVIIAAAALAGAAGAVSNALADATVLEGYNYSGADNPYLVVQNNDTFGYTDVTIGGNDYGALAAGATSAVFNLPDNESGFDGSTAVTITANGNTYNGAALDVLGDVDVTTPPTDVSATITIPSVTAVPEPATWGLMLAGFAGLGAAMRVSRRKIAATA